MTEPRKEILSDGIELWLGDCRDVLPLIGRVDAVVTDPPYGVSLEYESTDDTPEFVRDVAAPIIAFLASSTKQMAVTPGTRMAFAYPIPTEMGCVYFPAGAGFSRWGFTCFQPILFYGKDPHPSNNKQPNSTVCTEISEKNGHPCPKPIRLMNWLVNRASLLDQIVCDPFMGSGTTGVACVNLGRKFIGIEIEPKYYDIAKRRISEALSRPRLPFDEPIQPKQEALAL